MADWLLDGDPGMDLWEMDVRRFGAQYRSPSYTLARVIENYETYYDIKYPGHERLAGRPLRMSPAYPGTATHEAELRREERLGAGQLLPVQRAARGRLDAPARLGGQALVAGDRGRAPRHPRVGRAVRRDVVRQDRGLRAGRRRRCSSGCATTVVARGPGRIVYTQMLNARGGIECDVTVTQVDDADLPDRDRDGVRRCTTWPGSAGTRRATGRCSCAT